MNTNTNNYYTNEQFTSTLKAINSYKQPTTITNKAVKYAAYLLHVATCYYVENLDGTSYTDSAKKALYKAYNNYSALQKIKGEPINTFDVYITYMLTATLNTQTGCNVKIKSITSVKKATTHGYDVHAIYKAAATVEKPTTKKRRANNPAVKVTAITPETVIPAAKTIATPFKPRRRSSNPAIKVA